MRSPREARIGILFRIYINALLNGNPIAVVPTLIVAVVLGSSFFYEGISQRDPAAIAFAVIAGLMLIVVLAIAIVDRRLNPKKPRTPARSNRR